MDPLEVHTDSFSFIIKIWLEEDDGWTTWRGHITHVPSGERVYIQKLDSLLAFITSYLKAAGVQVSE